jgi:LEA14-like dessication related protein
MNGIRMATGVSQGPSLPRGGSTVPMTTYLANERTPARWVSHLNNGERTELAVSADVHSSALGTTFGAPKLTRTVETEIISAFNATERRPVGEEGANGEPVLYVEETGATEGHGTIPPESTRTIRTTTVLDNGNVDGWWVTRLENDQRTELRIEPPTGATELPLAPLTYTEPIETDSFDIKNGTATDGAGTATPTPTDDGLLDVRSTRGGPQPGRSGNYSIATCSDSSLSARFAAISALRMAYCAVCWRLTNTSRVRRSSTFGMSGRPRINSISRSLISSNIRPTAMALS